MKHILMLFVLGFATTVAMGQDVDPFKIQRACYVQAHKVASKGTLVSVSNHYDARTKTCWVKEFQNTNGAVDESVYNAFEPNISEAEFAGSNFGYVKVVCFVHDRVCQNVAEFETLAKARYGF